MAMLKLDGEHQEHNTTTPPPLPAISSGLFISTKEFPQGWNVTVKRPGCVCALFALDQPPPLGFQRAPPEAKEEFLLPTRV